MTCIICHHDTGFHENFIEASSMSLFPPGLENRENLEKWEGNFQSGNFTQNPGKIRKNYTGKLKNLQEKQEDVYGRLLISCGRFPPPPPPPPGRLPFLPHFDRNFLDIVSFSLLQVLPILCGRLPFLPDFD